MLNWGSPPPGGGGPPPGGGPPVSPPSIFGVFLPPFSPPRLQKKGRFWGGGGFGFNQALLRGSGTPPRACGTIYECGRRVYTSPELVTNTDEDLIDISSIRLLSRI